MNSMCIATVKAVNGNKATVEMGSGESKTMDIPKGVTASVNNKALVAKVAGKYLIINVY